MRTFRNALSNIGAGAAAAVLALVVPIFLTRSLTTDRYGVWALLLDIGAYTSLFKLGIQPAISRFVAQSNHLRDTKKANVYVSTAVVLMLVSTAIASVVLGLITWYLPKLFSKIPPSLIADSRIALLFVGGSLAIGLPAVVFTGVLAGIHRFDLNAITNTANKLIAACAIIAIARLKPTLAAMATGWALVNLVTFSSQFVLYRRYASSIRIRWRDFSQPALREILDYCYTLALWNICMLMVSGLDTTIVGFFSFHEVAYYAVAATLTTFIAGIQNAAFSPLVPVSAELQVQTDSQRKLSDLLLRTTRYSTLLVASSAAPFLIFGQPILRLWVGSSYALHAVVILDILVIANMIRLTATPYAVLLMGTGAHRLANLSPVVEAISNFTLSILLGWRLGAAGVALGTLIGAIAGIALHCAYNLPRTPWNVYSLYHYCRHGVAQPILCFTPLALYALLIHTCVATSVGAAAVMALSAVLTLIAVWRIGLSEQDRFWLQMMVARIATLPRKPLDAH